jgi:glycosyltransferase involved in cell wall biosynthesis
VDSRVKVIHQKNSGVAKARNAGLDRVTGEYIFFVDSDDIVSKHAIEYLVALAVQHEADMVCSTCMYIDESGRVIDSGAKKEMDLCMDKTQALYFYTTAEWAPWNRLIRSNVHKNICFPNYQIHEDEAIKFFLLERCQKVIHTYEKTYYYRQRDSSITGATSKTDRMDMFYSRRENLIYLEKTHPTLVSPFLSKVCEDALLNLDLLSIKQGVFEDARLSELVSFFKKYKKLIWESQYVSVSQKLRCFLIVNSNWMKKNNLYTRFYSFLANIRERN